MRFALPASVHVCVRVHLARKPLAPITAAFASQVRCRRQQRPLHERVLRGAPTRQRRLGRGRHGYDDRACVHPSASISPSQSQQWQRCGEAGCDSEAPCPAPTAPTPPAPADEVTEMITDPELDAWRDAAGRECAGACCRRQWARRSPIADTANSRRLGSAPANRLAVAKTVPPNRTLSRDPMRCPVPRPTYTDKYVDGSATRCLRRAPRACVRRRCFPRCDTPSPHPFRCAGACGRLATRTQRLPGELPMSNGANATGSCSRCATCERRAASGCRALRRPATPVAGTLATRASRCRMRLTSLVPRCR